MYEEQNNIQEFVTDESQGWTTARLPKTATIIGWEEGVHRSIS